MELNRIFLFLHLAFGLMFFFAHGTTLAVAFGLFREKRPPARAALLSIAGSVVAPTFGGFFGMAVFGVALGVSSSSWRQGWWWLSIFLTLGAFAWMIWYSRKYYSPIRKALGLAYVTGFARENLPEDAVASQEEVNRLIAQTRPGMVTWIAALVTAATLYLMVFKPF